ncbi:hypothetical protein INT44_004440 [Umbelopsis vinacea]|uniref:Uncharacterized protein n=1 Tax=Umbelopsis vinacea TaxID=44442 RepID=A0A8H7QCR6_9FUNG|nr:hypothetical protein INT44_004440 [Umbelopsis vinacea]
MRRNMKMAIMVTATTQDITMAAVIKCCGPSSALTLLGKSSPGLIGLLLGCGNATELGMDDPVDPVSDPVAGAAVDNGVDDVAGT